MKKKPLLNSSEFKTLQLLEKGFKYTPYEVKCMVRMQAVIEEEQTDLLDPKLQQTLRTSEFDFVVYSNARALEPLFAVEFDGPHHQFDQEQISRDIRKNRLCHLAKFPLIRITDTELKDLDKYSILEFIISRFRAWQKSSGKIKREIADYIGTLSEDQKNDLVANGFADPSIDETFHFDLRNPFPKTIEVVKRLLFKHKIVTILSETFLKNLTKREDYYLFADVFAYMQHHFDGHDIVARSDYVISKSNKSFFGIKTISSAKDKQASTILEKGTINFRTRCTLPIVSNYDPDEVPIDYYLRTGEFPISFQELPGVTAFDIANNISEYLGYRQIEKWAEQLTKEGNA